MATPMSAPTPSRLTIKIVVPTFHRPSELARILAAINASVTHAISADPDLLVSVLVIDNDPGGSARAIVLGLRPQPDYVVEGSPGLAAVRNRALDEAVGHRLLLFLDDDEEPTTGWLSSMIKVWRATQADAVLGRVVSVFEVKRSRWLQAVGAFERPPHATGDLLSAAATNNLLLDLNRIRALGLRFAKDMGMSGGEDSLFTMMLVRSGGRIVWADDAVVLDHVPQNRMTRHWMLVRTFRGGTVDAAIDRHLARNRFEQASALILSAGQGVVRVLGGAARFGYGVARGQLSHQALGQRAVARGAGKFLGAFGYRYQEYARRANRRES